MKMEAPFLCWASALLLLLAPLFYTTANGQTTDSMYTDMEISTMFPTAADSSDEDGPVCYICDTALANHTCATAKDLDSLDIATCGADQSCLMKLVKNDTYFHLERRCTSTTSELCTDDNKNALSCTETQSTTTCTHCCDSDKCNKKAGSASIQPFLHCILGAMVSYQLITHGLIN